MFNGTLPGIAGSTNESISIGTPFENSSWLTPEENAERRRARSVSYTHLRAHET